MREDNSTTEVCPYAYVTPATDRSPYDVESFDREGRDVIAGINCLSAASFASRYANKEGRTFPQAIAHRGYGKTYTENSIKAFEDAVNVGAHALETDVHLSKDGTVVLSHVKISSISCQFTEQCTNAGRRMLI